MSEPALALILFFGTALIIGLVWKLNLIDRLFRDESKYRVRIKEDILKALFKVEEANRHTNLEALSNALKISNDTVLKLVEEMTQDDLIKLSNDQLILTTSGKKRALEIIRGHRLWETYLAEKTGINKKDWHDLAEKKEHNLTTQELDDLYIQLGSPRYDPHGDPIPTKDGEMFEPAYQSLVSFSLDAPARIAHIEDEPAVVYKQIIDQNLFVGSQIKILDSSDKSVRFLCEGNEYNLSPIVASNISLQPLTEHDLYEASNTRLTNLSTGEKARVIGISSECRGPNRRRLLDLGFVPGTPIEKEYNGPLNDPKAYLVRNTLIALRKDQANHILIEKS